MSFSRFGIAAASLLIAVSPQVFGLDDIELPPGFGIDEYADVPNARSRRRVDVGQR